MNIQTQNGVWPRLELAQLTQGGLPMIDLFWYLGGGRWLIWDKNTGEVRPHVESDTEVGDE